MAAHARGTRTPRRLLHPRSRGLGVMVFGRLVAGVGVGGLSCAVPLYTAEMAPAKVRGALGSLQQLMVTIGILMAAIVNSVTSKHDHGWRVSLGISCGFSSALAIGMLFLPDTARWLLKHRGEAAAKSSITRLYSGHPRHAKEELRLLKASAAAAESDAEGTWSDVFAGDMWRRLLVGWGTQFHQQLTGINVIMYYAVLIFASVGIPEYTGTIVIDVVNVLSTLLAMRTIDHYGRKWLLLTGAAVQCICFVIAGLILVSTDITPQKFDKFNSAASGAVNLGAVKFSEAGNPSSVNVKSLEECYGKLASAAAGPTYKYFTYHNDSRQCQLYELADPCATTLDESVLSGAIEPTCGGNAAAGYLVVVFIALYVIGFGASWGPVAWVVGAEIYPLKVRGKALSISTAAGNWLGTFLVGYATPAILAGLGTGGTIFLFAYFLFQCFVFVLFLVPETKGKSLEQIDKEFITAKSWRDISRWPSYIKGLLSCGRTGSSVASYSVVAEETDDASGDDDDEG